jgi:hypothetical protein
MTSTIGPQPPATEGPGSGNSSTWLILAAAVAFVGIAQFSLGGASETRECTREAHENAAIANAMGGEARYVEMCMALHKKVREMGQRK